MFNIYMILFYCRPEEPWEILGLSLRCFWWCSWMPSYQQYILKSVYILWTICLIITKLGTVVATTEWIIYCMCATLKNFSQGGGISNCKTFLVIQQKLKIEDNFEPTDTSKRGWIVPPLGSKGNMSADMIIGASLPAFLLFILLFLETQITE